MRGLIRRALRELRNDSARERLEAQVRELELADKRVMRMISSTREQMDVVALAATDTARAHTEAATQAALDAALAASRAHTEAAVAAAVESAVAAAREHSEAAVAAAVESAVAAAREHSEAAARASADSVIAATGEYAEASAAATLAAARRHAEELSEQSHAEVQRSLAGLRREMRAAQRSAGAPAAAVTPSSGSDKDSASVLDPAFYLALEDRFRGSSEAIEERQQMYVGLVEHLVDEQYPLADLGCGRGEWLNVLKRAGVSAFGVDSNPVFTTNAVEDGLDVRAANLVTFLAELPDQSLGAITMFQVVEHLPFPVLLDVLADCARVLRVGGILIAETPNARNLRVAASAFWLDPTHQRPLPPELLEFVAGWCGFAKSEGLYVNPLAVSADTPPQVTDERIDRLVDLIDGPGDYALLAWV